MDNKTVIDRLFDENDNENIKLFDENGKEQEFYQVGLIPLDDICYAILAPVNYKELGLEEGQVFIYKINENEDKEEESIELVNDDNIASKVLDELNKLVEEAK